MTSDVSGRSYQTHHIHVSDLVMELVRAQTPTLGESVVLKVPVRSQPNSSSSSGVVVSGEMEVLWKKEYSFSQAEISLSDAEALVPIRSMLTTLKPGNIFSVLCHMLMEKRIIFVANDGMHLLHCIQALLLLLYPFKWSHVCVPVVPTPLLNLCSLLCPFIIGIRRPSVPEVCRMPLESHVWVDLDNDSLEVRLSGMDDEGEFVLGENLIQRKGKDDVIGAIGAVRELAKKGSQMPALSLGELARALYRLYDSQIPGILSYCLDNEKEVVRVEFPYDDYVRDSAMVIQPFMLNFLPTKMVEFYLQGWVGLCLKRMKKGVEFQKMGGMVLNVVYDLSILPGFNDTMGNNFFFFFFFRLFFRFHFFFFFFFFFIDLLFFSSFPFSLTFFFQILQLKIRGNPKKFKDNHDPAQPV